MTEQVDLEKLQRATDKTLQRFRTFNVYLAKGFFWSYLRDSTSRLIVGEESDYPAALIEVGSPGAHLLRVFAFGRRIGVEFFHAVTDGSGGLEFLKSLLHTYLSLDSDFIPTEDKVVAADSLPRLGEDSDSFEEYRAYCKEIGASPAGSPPPARRVKGTNFDIHGHNVTELIVPAKNLTEAAHKYGVTVSGFLTAVTLAALAQTTRGIPGNDPFIVAMPLNLRRVLPSRTFRNFFAVARIGYTCAPDDPFTVLATKVKAEIDAALTLEAIATTVNETTQFDGSLPARFTPNVVKRRAIRYGFRHFSENNSTVTLSNLGNVVLPSGMTDRVERLSFNLCSSPQAPLAIAVVSYGDTATISFTRCYVESDFVRAFAELLVQHDCNDVSVTGNQWGV